MLTYPILYPTLPYPTLPLHQTPTPNPRDINHLNQEPTYRSPSLDSPPLSRLELEVFLLLFTSSRSFTRHLIQLSTYLFIRRPCFETITYSPSDFLLLLFLLLLAVHCSLLLLPIIETAPPSQSVFHSLSRTGLQEIKRGATQNYWFWNGLDGVFISPC